MATALVMTLCRLHNYCIKQNIDPEDHLDDDVAYSTGHGGFVLEKVGNRPNLPTPLLGGGEHFDDAPRNVRRSRTSSSQRQKDLLHSSVVDQCLCRPRPHGW